MPEYRTIELLDGDLILRQKIETRYSLYDPDYLEIRAKTAWEITDHREGTSFADSNIAQTIMEMYLNEKPIPFLSELCLSNLHGVYLAMFIFSNMEKLYTDQIYSVLTQLRKEEPNSSLSKLINDIEIKLSWMKKERGTLNYAKQKRELFK